MRCWNGYELYQSEDLKSVRSVRLTTHHHRVTLKLKLKGLIGTTIRKTLQEQTVNP